MAYNKNYLGIPGFENVEEAIEHRNASHQQMLRCWKCASYGHGCHGDVIGCGAFTPKNRF